MPEPAVRAAWVESGEIEACASRFHVSPAAMNWRLYNFDLVQAAPATQAPGFGRAAPTNESEDIDGH
jgi:hypothetical protein